MSSILRTPIGCFKFVSDLWGSCYAPIVDPTATDKPPSQEVLKSFQMNPDFLKIPVDIWTAWVDLCFLVAKEYHLEVMVQFFRKNEPPFFPEWKALVPYQTVSGGAVRTNPEAHGAIDLLSGEVYGGEVSEWPPEDWVWVGDAHLHPFAMHNFSAVDDHDDFSIPGTHCHLLVSLPTGWFTSQTYNITASMVVNGKRFKIDYNEMITLPKTQEERADYHPDVLRFIQKQPFAITGSYGYGGTTYTSPAYKPYKPPQSTAQLDSYAHWQDRKFAEDWGDLDGYDYYGPAEQQEGVDILAIVEEILPDDGSTFFTPQASSSPLLLPPAKSVITDPMDPFQNGLDRTPKATPAGGRKKKKQKQQGRVSNRGKVVQEVDSLQTNFSRFEESAFNLLASGEFIESELHTMLRDVAQKMEKNTTYLPRN